MPLTTAAVLGFIPNNIWSPLKKFLSKDGVITFDLAFKIATKYTPALLTVGICLSFANQFVRNTEIDCVTSGNGDEGASGGGGRRGGSSVTSSNSELNDYCWNHDTFLVLKALEPDMRGEVSYPGVSGYRKDRDKVIHQRYYKFVWMILGKMAVFSFLPYFFWKVRGATKIKPLLDVTSSVVSEDITEHDIRVKYFLETVGFNQSFALYYFLCKMVATCTPVAEYIYLCGIIGPLYKYYGVAVFSHFLDSSAPWPNPMDVLFPKMAKCNWIQYGFGGDPEIKSAQCQLPMNNLTQWSFFVFWWWLAFVFVVNFLSLLRVMCFMCGPYRRQTYRSFVARACRDDVQKARSYSALNKGKMENKQFKIKDIIHVKLSFGDVLVLSFIKRNLQEWEFRDFIRTIAVTKNTVLQLKPVISMHTMTPLSELGRENKGVVLEMGFIHPNNDDHDASSQMTPTAPNMTPYSDQSTETVVTDGQDWSDSALPHPPPAGWSIKINDPVVLDRRPSSFNLGASKTKLKGKSDRKQFNAVAPGSGARYPGNNIGMGMATSTPKRGGTNYGGDESWAD